mmetsp:Transcript_6387/g.15308  ORF Transcript_6387/g.15308 Transcript_6387/m.15308 type:complete len:122 (-) Transcript_6387:11-376(-)
MGELTTTTSPRATAPDRTDHLSNNTTVTSPVRRFIVGCMLLPSQHASVTTLSVIATNSGTVVAAPSAAAPNPAKIGSAREAAIFNANPRLGWQLSGAYLPPARDPRPVVWTVRCAATVLSQ